MTARAVLTTTYPGRPGVVGGALRPATAADAPAIHALIAKYQAVGRLLPRPVADEARLAGFRTVCAFTHHPAYFVRLGYSLVPHAWLPEKIARDCASCVLLRRCGQDAVRLQLAERGPRV